MNEMERLSFIESRDGLAAAILTATQILKVYRRSVLCSRKRGAVRPHHASLPEYRRGFIESYCVCKKFILERHGT